MADEPTNATETAEPMGQVSPEQQAVEDLDIVEPEYDDYEDQSIKPDDTVPGEGGTTAEGDDQAAEDKAGEGADTAGAKTDQPAISDADWERAKKFGFADEDRARYTGVDELDRHIGFLARKIQAAQAPPSQQTGQQATADQQQQQQVQGPASGPVLPRYEMKISEDVEPSITETITGMNEHYAGQVDMLANAIVELVGHVQGAIAPLHQQFSSSVEERIDSLFEATGEDWRDVFGQGETVDLKPDSAERKAREKVTDAMVDFAAAARATGSSAPRIARLFQRALKAEFADVMATKAASKAKGKISQQLNRQAPRIGVRPAGRKTDDNRSPDDRAVANVAAKLREFGIAEDESDALID